MAAVAETTSRCAIPSITLRASASAAPRADSWMNRVSGAAGAPPTWGIGRPFWGLLVGSGLARLGQQYLHRREQGGFRWAGLTEEDLGTGHISRLRASASPARANRWMSSWESGLAFWLEHGAARLGRSLRAGVRIGEGVWDLGGVN
jgi:hypothetical protein